MEAGGEGAATVDFKSRPTHMILQSKMAVVLLVRLCPSRERIKACLFLDFLLQLLLQLLEHSQEWRHSDSHLCPQKEKKYSKGFNICAYSWLIYYVNLPPIAITPIKGLQSQASAISVLKKKGGNAEKRKETATSIKWTKHCRFDGVCGQAHDGHISRPVW